MEYIFLLGLVLSLLKLNLCLPHNSTVLSKYAKLAVYGNNNTDEVPRPVYRNNKGGNIRNHRLDSKNISPTTKKKDLSISYQYPVYQSSNSKSDKRIEHVPGIGEVIVGQAQDRFEARPLFAYRNKVDAPTYGPPLASPPPNPGPLAPGPIAPPSPPVPTNVAPPPLSSPAASGDIYSSPYTSYNPPDFKPDDSLDGQLYPPISSDGNNSPVDAAASPALIDNDMSDLSKAPKANKPDSYESLDPPLAPYDNDNPSNGNDYQDQAPPQDSMAMYKYNDGPPQHPPKSLDDIYYPPDFPKDQIHNHGGVGNHVMKEHHMIYGGKHEDAMKDPHMILPPDNHDEISTAEHHSGIMPQDNDDSKSSGDASAYAPMDIPPSPDYEHGHAFPQYLYDHHHYDHHVYDEIPHTTMAPAKEDKRVSSTNYSYYYLGRKLWYIPLYFSIYFIIYVTVLILKSIARHKVRLKYKWYEHDTNAKQARSMDLGSIRNEEISNLHETVAVGLKNATARYDSVVAM